MHDCARRNMSLIAIDTFAKHQQIDGLLRRLYSKNLKEFYKDNMKYKFDLFV